ncbi:DUF1517 domain-containing protein [Synechocystis sp. LKSZ1]|uniref:DUF1517 domain-containing protein n=1 Tax=Synechocystis sp. LKSZ1 TaxID=3144951 RepID=UPI00336BFDB5
MLHSPIPRFRSLLKPALALGLSLFLLFGHSAEAWAARSGGRIGGGSFRAPSRSYSTPSRSYRSGGSYGGGIGFPFLLPFFGFGGFGSLLGLLVVIAIANLFINVMRGGSNRADGNFIEEDNPLVSIAQLQVGLLASAKVLKTDLDQLGVTADTGTPAGRIALLQEASLALLRHPEYWVYSATQVENAPLSLAEAQFNQLSLRERSKFTAETLSNVNSQLRRVEQSRLPGNGIEDGLPLVNDDYILVTILVATLGKLSLPTVNDASDLRQALQKLGGIGGEQLLAVEVLWTPQAERDTLSRDDLLVEYPNLKLI